MKRLSEGVCATGEGLDSYSRLLAYVSPWYETSEFDASSDRTTFNLNLIESGWATFFPFYPSLPKNNELNLALDRAVHAWDMQLGAWADHGETFLLAYEYRMLVKLSADPGGAETLDDLFDGVFCRHCIDLRLMTDVGTQGFVDVPPPYRLWVKASDLDAAKDDLGM